MKNVLRSKKVHTLLIAGTLLGSTVLTGGHALANEEKSFEELLVEWEAAGLDTNHTEAIEKIKAYVEQNIEPGVFASLHIDREQDPFGVVVLSFTKELSEAQKEEIAKLAEEPSEISIRVVEYTEQELNAKQAEIDKAVFEEGALKDLGITVYHTGTDIINNKVELGIDPFNEANVKAVKDYFGNPDYLNVVEGHQAHTLESSVNAGEATEDAEQAVPISAEVDVMPISAVDEAEKQGFFAKIWAWFSGIFK
ncbi:hypothetical protein [Bacillus horti]|uniref:Uncharacterized protein n=1 Tax=Caldalkalibacillus horti TaxID=77523 RepID=A0ABT9W074_9BACI|nr:hypothetical protein [Bacillus horti]MDQ0166660.1 hypothetical protein [Bacillus horti]